MSRLQRRQQGYIVGGIIGGMLPFASFILLGWFLWTH